jgi:hypothetical protein
MEMISLTIEPRPLVLLLVDEVEFVGGGGGFVPPGPLPGSGELSAKTGQANMASAPEKTSNRIVFFIGRGILRGAKRALL